MLLRRIVLLYIVLLLCRIVFYCYNYALIGPLGWQEVLTLAGGGLKFDTEYRRYFRELHFSDAGKVVRYLLLFVSYLFRIGEHLPFAAAAYTVVLTERNGSYR